MQLPGACSRRAAFFNSHRAEAKIYCCYCLFGGDEYENAMDENSGHIDDGTFVYSLRGQASWGKGEGNSAEMT